jgi:hypothetical protein
MAHAGEPIPQLPQEKAAVEKVGTRAGGSEMPQGEDEQHKAHALTDEPHPRGNRKVGQRSAGGEPESEAHRTRDHALPVIILRQPKRV